MGGWNVHNNYWVEPKGPLVFQTTRPAKRKMNKRYINVYIWYINQMGLSLFVAAPTENEVATATVIEPTEIIPEPVLISDEVPDMEPAERELYTVYEDSVYDAIDHNKRNPKRNRVRAYEHALSPEKNTLYQQRKQNDRQLQKEIRTFRQTKYDM